MHRCTSSQRPTGAPAGRDRQYSWLSPWFQCPYGEHWSKVQGYSGFVFLFAAIGGRPTGRPVFQRTPDFSASVPFKSVPFITPMTFLSLFQSAFESLPAIPVHFVKGVVYGGLTHS